MKHFRHGPGAEKHDGKARQPQGEENPDGGAEQPPLLVLPALRLCLGHQLAQRQGQTRRGDRQQNVVDLIGGVKVGLALLAQDVVEGDFVKEANAFDNGYCRGQNGRAAQEGLFFLSRHKKHTSKPFKNARTVSVREGRAPLSTLWDRDPPYNQIPSSGTPRSEIALTAPLPPRRKLRRTWNFSAFSRDPLHWAHG